MYTSAPRPVRPSVAPGGDHDEPHRDSRTRSGAALRPPRPALYLVPDRRRVPRRRRRERLSRAPGESQPRARRRAAQSSTSTSRSATKHCSYCGCHVISTPKREVAAQYLDYLGRELELVAGLLPERRGLIQMHWGGGTPTYLEPAQLEQLFAAGQPPLRARCRTPSARSRSIPASPRRPISRRSPDSASIG